MIAGGDPITKGSDASRPAATSGPESEIDQGTQPDEPQPPVAGDEYVGPPQTAQQSGWRHILSRLVTPSS